MNLASSTGSLGSWFGEYNTSQVTSCAVDEIFGLKVAVRADLVNVVRTHKLLLVEQSTLSLVNGSVLSEHPFQSSVSHT